jgi:hypothetical protein
MVCEWFGLKTTRTVFSGLTSKPVDRVFGLGLKTGTYGLVIWASKSPRRFLGLRLKIKHALVCQLRHKTDGGRTVQDMRRDLPACFA